MAQTASQRNSAQRKVASSLRTGSYQQSSAASAATKSSTTKANLSSAQFGGSYMGGLHANLAKAGYAKSTPKPGQFTPKPMNQYRNNLRQAALGSAASSNSLGAALNASGGSMFGGSVAAPSQALSQASSQPKPSLAGRALGFAKTAVLSAAQHGKGSANVGVAAGKGSLGKSSGMGSVKKVGLVSKHAGKLAQHLISATGSM